MATKNVVSFSIMLSMEQAKNEVEKYKKVIDQTADALDVVKKKIAGLIQMEPGETIGGLEMQRKQYEKELKLYKRNQNDIIKSMEGVEQLMNRLTTAKYNEITAARTQLTNAMKRINLEEQDDVKKFQNLSKWRQQIIDEINKRNVEYSNTINRQKSEQVLRSPGRYSTSEVEQAIKAMQSLQSVTKRNSQEWQDMNVLIENGKKKLDEWSNIATAALAKQRQANLASLSTRALDEQRKYWQQEVDGAEQGTKAYDRWMKKLEQVNKEIERRKADEAGKVMGNLAGSSVSEINDAIKATEQLRDAQQLGSAQWTTYNTQIESAKKYLKDYADAAKQTLMEGQLKNLTDMSSDALSEQKKYWQTLIDGASKSDPLLKTYIANLEKINKEMTARKADEAGKVMGNLNMSSVSEIQEAIKATEQLRDAQILGTIKWNDYNKQIEDAKNYLEEYKREVEYFTMKDKLSTLYQASDSSLEEQRKYWQTMINGAEHGSHSIALYAANLKKVVDEEQRRKAVDATDIMQRINAGWDDSVQATEDAIKKLKEYRATLKTDDTAGLKSVDEAITQLNIKLKQSEEGFMSLGDILSRVKGIDQGIFSATIEDLEKMKKRLLELRKTAVDIGGQNMKKELKKIDDALLVVDRSLASATGSVENFEEFITHIDSKSMTELKAAAEQLSKELENTATNQKDFIEKSRQLREVNRRIKEVNKMWGETSGVIARTAKRLASYVLVYTGFNKITGYVRGMIQENMKLSDSFADIRKTTGLTEEAVRSLSKQIDDIDTRTSQESLHQLAVVAGQIGLRGTNDILGFVKASNQINVALSELGDDGVATLMKLAQLTGDVNMGVEQSLIAIGSAINELSANSAATAAPIVDMMSRLGGIAAQANISSADMAALGASFDALNQPIEMAGTSLNKFIAELMSKTENVAYALNMDAKYLKNLTATGQTTEAMLAVFRRMSEITKEGTDGFAVLNGVMGDLGSEGARMSQILRTASENVDFITEQVELSRQAFADATSVTNEYNVKNENAMALMLRIGNMLKEIFVNASPESWISNVMRSLHSFVKSMLDGGTAAKNLVGAITALGFALAAFKLHMLATSYPAKRLQVALKNLKDGAWSVDVAFKSLSRTMKANIFGIVASVIGYLAGRFIFAKDSVDSMTRSISENNNELNLQTSRVAFLRDQLSKENLARKDKIKYINELNKNYGNYLGFMLKETDSTEKLMKATQFLNAELRKRAALSLENTIKEKLNEKYVDKFAEITEKVGKTAKNLSQYGEAQTASLVELVTRTAEENLNAPAEVVNEMIKKNLMENEKENDHILGLIKFVTEATHEYIAAKKQYNQDFQAYESMGEATVEAATKQALSARREMMEQIRSEYETLRSQSTDGFSEDAQREHYQRLLELDKSYRTMATEQMKDASDEEKKSIIEQTALLDRYAVDIKKKLAPLMDAWGKGPNLRGWLDALQQIESGADLSGESLDKLAKAYDNIQKESMKISDVNAYNKMFGTPFTSLNQVLDDAKKKAGIIRDKLKEYGRGVNGEFLWGADGGDKEAKRKAKEEYQAALSALEAYYAERETVVRQKMLEQGASEAETNRQLEALNVEHWNDQKQLYMTLLEEMYQKASFDKKKFVGPLSGIDYFGKKDLDTLRTQLERWGIALEDGMKHQMNKAELKIAEQAQKVNLRIQKLLLEDDFNAQVLKQYTESLDELGLLYNQMAESEEQRTRQSNATRMTLLRSYADQSYTLTADTLRRQMEQQTLFQEWVKGRTADDYEALLIMLRKYHDDVSEADRKQAERRKKIIESSEAAILLEAKGKKADKQNETSASRLEGFQQLGLVSENPKEQLQIDYYKQKITLAEQYINLIHLEMQAERMKASVAIETLQSEIAARRQMGLDTADLEAKLMARQQEQQSLQRQEMQLTEDKRNEITAQTENLNQIFMEREQRKLEEVKKYTDALVTFAGDMGEAAFGEVEDRKEAGRQLIKTLLTTLKDWAQVKLTELALKQMFANQSAAIEGQEVITDLTMQGAKTTADVAAGTASATAKEAGKLGLVGLAVGAAIGAALKALLGVTLGSISKSKSEVAAASNSGTRLATGMLTYAQGKYPVLGNDGQVYDAKYEGAGLKTGVYSGGPRVGIFSEKQPEAVIDGRTTRRLVVDYPGLWQAILSLSRGGSLPRQLGGVRTYAQGNLDQLPRTVQQMESAGASDNARLLQALEQSNRIQQLLMKRLEKPIEASINMYGDHGMKRSMDRAERFSAKRKI